MLLLTPDQQHETTVFARLVERGTVKRSGRGQPRCRPRRVVGDKRYSSRANQRYLKRQGAGRPLPGDGEDYRHRSVDMGL